MGPGMGARVEAGVVGKKVLMERFWRLVGWVLEGLVLEGGMAAF